MEMGLFSTATFKIYCTVPSGGIEDASDTTLHPELFPQWIPGPGMVLRTGDVPWAHGYRSGIWSVFLTTCNSSLKGVLKLSLSSRTICIVVDVLMQRHQMYPQLVMTHRLSAQDGYSRIFLSCLLPPLQDLTLYIVSESIEELWPSEIFDTWK